MTFRLRALFCAAFLSATLSLILFRATSAQPADFSPAAVELLDAVNALRAQNNLPPYQPDKTLMSVAQAQADYVARTGVLSRFDAAGLPPHQRALNAGYAVAGDLSQGGLFAENLYSGPTSSVPAVVVEAWNAEPLKRAALLSSDFNDAGAGYAVAGGTVYYVLDVGSDAEVLLPDATPTFTAAPTLPKGYVITSTPNPDGSIYHVVQKDEGLWGIALSYNLTIADLKKINRLTTDDIYEGQKLLIFKPKPGPTITPTPGVTFTATFGLSFSTPTQPTTPTATSTSTPAPTPPASFQSGGKIIGGIVLIALLAAGLGAWLGRKKE